MSQILDGNEILGDEQSHSGASVNNPRDLVVNSNTENFNDDVITASSQIPIIVDFWAQWCGPCKREIPYLKEIEAEYHDKNIEFVSISIDREKDYDKWRAMVEDKELGGIQLLADKDWNSQFVEEYLIKGIPRFILVDPQGKIVNSNAPRPSDQKLRKVFNDLNL